MANGTVEVTVKMDKSLHDKLARMGEFKAIADEALSALNEAKSTDPEIIRIQELALRALIVGANI
jgi:hypothetical protein